MPADPPRGRIHAEKFALRRGVQVAVLNYHVDEIAALQWRSPDFLAGGAVDGDDGSFDADKDHAGLGHVCHRITSISGTGYSTPKLLSPPVSPDPVLLP